MSLLLYITEAYITVRCLHDLQIEHYFQPHSLRVKLTQFKPVSIQNIEYLKI